MIHSLTLDDYIGRPGIISIYNDFILVDNIDSLPYINEAFQTNNLLMFFCLKGHMHCCIDGKNYQVSSGDILICAPCKPMDDVLHSGDCKMITLGYAPYTVDHLLMLKQETFGVLDRSFFNPVLHYGEDYMNTHISILLDMLIQRALNIHLRFREKQCSHLFAVLLFEIINHANNHDEEELQKEYEKMGRPDTLFKEFIQKMTEDKGCHRTVAYYADALCISSKHLSKIIKQKTGKKAMQVIIEHAIEQIKLDLIHTNKPINTLADKYNFSNFSFFCQFVKIHLGMPPQEYRSKMR